MNIIKLIKEEYNNIINEIGDSSARSYQFNSKKDNEGTTVYEFITDSKTNYILTIDTFNTKKFSDKGNNGIYVEFNTDDNIGYNTENKGELYKVMSTISNIINDYIKNSNKPIEFISFVADDKRSKLYSNYLKNYNLVRKFDTQSGSIFYFFNNKLNEDYINNNQTEEDIQALVDIIDIDPDSPKMQMYKDNLKNKYNYEYIKPEIRYKKDIEIINNLINKKYNTITNKGLKFYFIIKPVDDLLRTVQVEIYNMNNNFIGKVGFKINNQEKSIVIGGADVKEEYRRKGIYTRIVDYIENIAKKYNLNIKEGSRSSDARSFWNNRNKMN